MGFRSCLDDFSAGHSSMSDIYKYHVDIVKLDRKMIIDASRDEQAASVLEEVTRLCHRLNIRVVAEGVENERQSAMIRKYGCDYVQGFYFAKPLPQREMTTFTVKHGK